MPHTTAAQHTYRERVGPRAFVRTPVPELDGAPRRLPARLPARLRRKAVLVVPPA